jgi:hypothetical protein
LIRRVVTQEDHVRVYALTGRGLVVASMLLGLAVTGMVLGVIALGRATHVQDTTCAVQSRGLAGQLHLTRIMHDLAVFVEGAPRERLPAPYRGALYDLRRELPAYTQLENAQPRRRLC